MWRRNIAKILGSLTDDKLHAFRTWRWTLHLYAIPFWIFADDDRKEETLENCSSFPLHLRPLLLVSCSIICTFSSSHTGWYQARVLAAEREEEVENFLDFYSTPSHLREFHLILLWGNFVDFTTKLDKSQEGRKKIPKNWKKVVDVEALEMDFDERQLKRNDNVRRLVDQLGEITWGSQPASHPNPSQPINKSDDFLLFLFTLRLRHESNFFFFALVFLFHL